MSILALSSFISLASACMPDLLLDNFPSIKQGTCIECGLEPDGTYPTRFFNLVGGDYGAKDAVITVNPNANGGHMQIVSVLGEPDDLEARFHPGEPSSRNYWYMKFDPIACFDLSKYTAIQFGIDAPAGTDFRITFTQRNGDCTERLFDSVYRNLTSFIKPDGTAQTVTLPLSNFSRNLNNEDFDFVHFKDLTFIDMTPDKTIKLSNMVLKGDCTGTTSASTQSVSPTETITSNNQWTATPFYSLLGLIGLLL